MAAQRQLPVHGRERIPSAGEMPGNGAGHQAEDQIYQEQGMAGSLCMAWQRYRSCALPDDKPTLAGPASSVRLPLSCAGVL